MAAVAERRGVGELPELSRARVPAPAVALHVRWLVGRLGPDRGAQNFQDTCAWCCAAAFTHTSTVSRHDA